MIVQRKVSADRNRSDQSLVVEVQHSQPPVVFHRPITQKTHTTTRGREAIR